MTERDLTRILTEHVAEVHLSPDAVRRIRTAAKEEPPVKKKMSFGLALVLVLTLLTTLGLAAGSGMLDFLLRTTGSTTLPEAVDLIETDLGSAENIYASYAITEAVYDGRSVSLMVEIKPADDRTLLLSEGWSLDLPYGALAYETEAEMLADPRTIADYAAEEGYTRIVEAGLNILYDKTSSYSGVDRWQDNTLTIVYSFDCTEEAPVIPVEYFAFAHQTDDPANAACSTPAELMLTPSAPLWRVSSDQVFDLPAYGVRIDGMTLTGTSLGMYCDLFYTRTSLAEDLKTFRPELCDMQGNYLQTSTFGNGGSWHAAEVGEKLTYGFSFIAMEEAPAQLMVRPEPWRSNQTEEPVQLTVDFK